MKNFCGYFEKWKTYFLFSKYFEQFHNLRTWIESSLARGFENSDVRQESHNVISCRSLSFESSCLSALVADLSCVVRILYTLPWKSVNLTWNEIFEVLLIGNWKEHFEDVTFSAANRNEFHFCFPKLIFRKLCTVRFVKVKIFVTF